MDDSPPSFPLRRPRALRPPVRFARLRHPLLGRDRQDRRRPGARDRLRHGPHPPPDPQGRRRHRRHRLEPGDDRAPEGQGRRGRRSASGPRWPTCGDFDMGRRYARIFCGFNGFAHCETIADQLACLRASLRALEPGGALVIHMSYPGPAYWLGAGRARPSSSTRSSSPAAASSSCGTTARRTSSARGRIRWSRSGSSTRRSARRPSTSSRRPSAGSIASSSSCSSPRRGSPGGTFLGGFDGRPLRAPDDQMIAWAFKAPAHGG